MQVRHSYIDQQDRQDGLKPPCSYEPVRPAKSLKSPWMVKWDFESVWRETDVVEWARGSLTLLMGADEG
jgi:hypothetical protein